MADVGTMKPSTLPCHELMMNDHCGNPGTNRGIRRVMAHTRGAAAILSTTLTLTAHIYPNALPRCCCSRVAWSLSTIGCDHGE